MAQTLAGSFKAYLETLALGVPVYRDGMPVVLKANGESVTAPPPAIVVQDGISVVPDASGDFGDADADTGSRELVQVDLFQLARVQVSPATTRNAENPVLIATLRRALRGRGIAPYAPFLVYGHRITGEQRWAIADNIARYTWTVEVARGDLFLTTTPAP